MTGRCQGSMSNAAPAVVSEVSEDSFAALFEESLTRKEMRTGEVITAEVVRVDMNYVVVNAGLKEGGETFLGGGYCGDGIRHRHLACARQLRTGFVDPQQKAKPLRCLALCHLFAPRYQSTTRAAACSALIDVVSSGRAPGLCLRGATLRVASRASRSRKSCKRAASVAAIPFSFNCLYRRSARASGLAVRNTLRLASGNTIEPMSRPSATSPGGLRKDRCLSKRARRTPGKAATREAANEFSSVRMASVTRSASRKISSPSKRTGSRTAIAASFASSPESIPSRAAAGP